MKLKIDKKRISVLILFLIVLFGIFFLETDVENKLKLFLSRIGIFRAGLVPGEGIFEEQELPEINIEKLLPQKKTEEEKIDRLSEKTVESVSEKFSPEYQETLLGIKKEVDRIEREVARVRLKVNQLKTLVDIQRKIEKINQEVKALKKEIGEIS